MSKSSIFLGKVIAFFFLLVFSISSFAQVTSSAISGVVSDIKGEGLPGATVIAIHTPSGTKYGAISDVNGRYVFPSVRVGGPYKVTVSYVGFKEQFKDGITANLGSVSNVNIKLSEDNGVLDELVVRSTKSDIFSSDRTGASTTIGKEAINAMPTIGRTINDFTRLTPQGNGRSFGGQDSRLNNITIDGAVFNNGFGLGDQPGARTGIAPISLDAIEEVQVNIAPFDVRQTGFTGAGINAVTKSGNNNFEGSIFSLTRNDNKSFIGSKAKGEKVNIADFSKNVLGFRLGGPILKDKLFFFVNAELEKSSAPASTWLANNGQTGSNVTRVKVSDLDIVTSQMAKLGFNTGLYENFNLNTVGNKFLARLDWNINQKNKFNVRYSMLDGGSENLINAGSGVVSGVRRGNADALSYQNSGYVLNEDISSITAELNTSISNKISNNLIIGYTSNNEDREYLTKLFPTIDIQEGGRTYISTGFDPFTPNNLLNYNTFQFFDNISIYKNKHTFTAGFSLERFQSNNSFYANSNGGYTYNSVADFVKATDAYLANPSAPTVGAIPRRFVYRYDFAGNVAPPLQIVKAWTPGLYFQDEIQARPNLKISLGLRVDIPILDQTSLENTYISTLNFKDENKESVKYNTGVLPSKNPLWSPRFGFNWDVMNDQKMQIRGGTGIFTGRPPFVWLSNQVGNNGILSGTFTPNDNTPVPFTLDFSGPLYKPATVDPYAATATYDIATADANYKFPQVWKSNLALDYKLPFGIIGTLEGIYNSNINSVYYINANLKDPAGFLSGQDNRLKYNGSATANRINSRVSNAVVLKSTNSGYSYSLSGKLEKPFNNGFFAMVAYNFGETKDLTSAGSIAATSYNNNLTVNGNNNPVLAFSDNDLRHRAIGAVSYRLDYGKLIGGSTTFSLFYEGKTQTRYSYAVAGDLNLDGNTNNDLLFVPQNANDMVFLPLTAGGKTFTAAQQKEAFEKYILQDKYLSSNRGKYAQRNGATLPWYNSLDFGVVQDIFYKTGNQKHNLQVRFDILNVGNLLNNDWGVLNSFVTGRPLISRGLVNGAPTYNLATQVIAGQTELLKDTYVPNLSTGSVWGAQLGLRYIFN